MAPPFRIQQTIDPNRAIVRLAEIQVAPLVGAIRFRERGLGIDLVLEVLGYSRKSAGVEYLRGFQQAGLGLADGCGANMLGCPGHYGHMLIAEGATGKSLFGRRELLKLPGDADAFRRSASRELAFGSQPGHEIECSVGGVFPALVEASQAFSEHCLQPVLRLSGVDESFTEPGAFYTAHDGCEIINRNVESRSGGLYAIG